MAPPVYGGERSDSISSSLCCGSIPGFIYQMGFGYVRDDQTELLGLERGGIRVNPRNKQQYEQLVATLRRRASGGFTYATPDCPEVYFLAGAA